jgi:hypothetical protein
MDRRAVAAGLGIVAAAAVVLRSMGRVWWCGCGSWSPVSWDIWSRHNSQHLVDPYTFTHVQHGLVFYAMLRLVVGERWLAWRAVGAVLIEAAWEVLENTPMVIERYREATVSLDYYGDSVLNSVADLGACAVGFLLASRLPTRVAVAGFVLTEVVLMLWIRDSLLLNVLMLLWPIGAIREWQSA